jgi:peptide/nickel transport system substrate-binding protein
MKTTNIFAITILLSVSLIIFSCGRKKEEVTETKKDNTTNLTPLAPPDTKDAVVGDWVVKQELADAQKLNPLVTNDASATDIYIYIFEGLIGINRVNYEPVPLLAKSLPVMSDDHLSYTFELKDDVNYSDGKQMTGEDILFTLKAIKIPFTDAQALRNYFDDVKDAELVDGNKFKIKINMTKPNFRTIYSFEDLRALPRHILDKDGIVDKITFEEIAEAQKNPDPKKYPQMQKFADFLNSQDVSREPKYVVGTGPYVLEKWQTGQAITLKRNDNYWNKKEIPNYPEKIIFKTIQDQNAAVVAAKNKEIDYMYVIQAIDFVENLKNPEQFNLKKALVIEPTYAYLGWNNAKPLFADKKVRLALSYAVDRKSIIDNILYGMAVPVQSSVFYKSKYYNTSLPEIEYNPEKAKQLLAEAGWKDTDGDGILDKVIDGKKTDFKFTFMSNGNPGRKKILLIVSESLKQIGIQSDIQDYEWSVFLDKTKKHDFDATYGAWQLSTAPEDPFQIFHSSQSKGEGSNYISYINPESDKLIEENRVEFDDNKRAEILKKWQEIIYEDQPVTFLWTTTSRYVYSDRFRNTRWYSYPSSALLNEWWSAKDMQRYQ